MTDHEFFKLDQLLWYTEFVEQELSKKIQDTCHHQEISLLDVPF